MITQTQGFLQIYFKRRRFENIRINGHFVKHLRFLRPQLFLQLPKLCCQVGTIATKFFLGDLHIFVFIYERSQLFDKLFNKRLVEQLRPFVDKDKDMQITKEEFSSYGTYLTTEFGKLQQELKGNKE